MSGIGVKRPHGKGLEAAVHVASVCSLALACGNFLARPALAATGDVVTSMAPSWSATVNKPISAFDTSTDNYTAWRFYPGSEFPGAKGSLGESTGVNNSRAASLAYDLGCGRTADAPLDAACGRYVSMDLAYWNAGIDTSALPQPTIGMWIRNAQGIARPTLRITDNTRQVLQFKVQLRTLEQPGAGDWQYVEVPISTSASFYNGAADGVLHPPIKGISVMNGDLPMAYTPGTMEVDNVHLLSKPSTSFELLPNAPLSSKVFPTTYVGRIGVSMRTYTTAALDKMAAAGIKLIRKDLCWACVEVKGQISFTRYDTMMADLAARGLSVLWILDYGHPDHGGATPLTDADRNAFAEYARQAAIKYKSAKVLGYEIWNEPNLPSYWPKPDAKAYGDLFHVTQAAIRSVNTSAAVVTGGISADDFTYLYKMVGSRQIYAATAVGLHAYRKNEPESYAADLQPLLKVLRTGGMGAGVWDTEWGYSAYGDIDAKVYGNGADPRAQRRQGVLTLRKVLTNIALNTPVSVLYNLMDSGTSATDREHNFGLLKADGADKPAIVGLRSLFAAQNNRILKGFLPEVPPNLHVLRWDGSGDQAFVVWTDRANGFYTVTLPAKTTSVKLWDGTVIAPTVTGPTRQITVNEGAGPVFVTVSQ